MSKRVRLRIEGRVQGVYFRESARREAERLHLSGWVANQDDGSVAAVAEGATEAIEAFVAWCHRGPPAAQVVRVDVTPDSDLGALGGFRVRR